MPRLLNALGLSSADAPTTRGTVHDRIRAELGHLGPERVEHLAAFAGLLARAAFGDAVISPAEEGAMTTCLREHAGLSEKEADLVAHIARNAAEALHDMENHLLTRAFNEHAQLEEKEALLDCLYAVAAADALVSQAEDAEIKQIGKALLVSHKRVMDIRLRYRDRIDGLRDLLPR